MIRLLEPWRTRLLWLSLGLNVFAVALIAAPHLWHRRPPLGPPGFDTIIERISRDLPAADATALRTAMAQEKPWYEISRRSLDEARTEAARQIAMTPFDPAAARTAMQAMQERLRESARRFDDSLALALAGLSPEGRTVIAQTMNRPRR